INVFRTCWHRQCKQDRNDVSYVHCLVGDVVAENLLHALPLSEMERKLIADAMHDYDPEKPAIHHRDMGRIGFLPHDKVIAALRKFYRLYGTTAACDLARKLQRKCCCGA